MKSETHLVAPQVKALNVGNPNMVRFGIADIQKTKLFKVKGEKTNFSVIDVFH